MVAVIDGEKIKIRVNPDLIVDLGCYEGILVSVIGQVAIIIDKTNRKYVKRDILRKIMIQLMDSRAYKIALEKMMALGIVKDEKSMDGANVLYIDTDVLFKYIKNRLVEAEHGTISMKQDGKYEIVVQENTIDTFIEELNKEGIDCLSIDNSLIKKFFEIYNRAKDKDLFFSSVRVTLALYKKIKATKENSNIKPWTWVRDIGLAMKNDKRTEEQLIGAIEWIYGTKEGAFWIPNILSGKKLREKYDTMELQMLRNNKVNRNLTALEFDE